ncbi:MAG: hypothetical protein H7843_15735 [Nitrospirota bacterium]
MGAKGDKKTGGRPKGAKNKRTLELENKLREAGFDPVSILVDMAVDTKTDDWLRAKICLDALQYLFPKRRAVDSAVTVDGHIETWEDRILNVNRANEHGETDDQA